MRVVLALLVAGCGRVGFDPIGDVFAAQCTQLVCGVQTYTSCEGDRDFAAASALCQARGLRLIYVDDAVENECLRAFVDAENINSVWLGLVQDPTAPGPDRFWNWPNNSTYFNWSGLGPQPDDDDGSEDGEENCATLNDADPGTASYGWFDQPCTLATGSICEPL